MLPTWSHTHWAADVGHVMLPTWGHTHYDAGMEPYSLGYRYGAILIDMDCLLMSCLYCGVLTYLGLIIYGLTLLAEYLIDMDLLLWIAYF